MGFIGSNGAWESNPLGTGNAGNAPCSGCCLDGGGGGADVARLSGSGADVLGRVADGVLEGE